MCIIIIFFALMQSSLNNMDNKELLVYAQEKYDKGAKEHNDDLGDKTPKELVKEALEDLLKKYGKNEM